MAHPDEVFTPPARARGRQPRQPVRARPAPGLRRVRARRSATATSAGGPTCSTTASATSCSTTGSALRSRGRPHPRPSGRPGATRRRLGLRSGSIERVPHRPRRRHARRHRRPEPGLRAGAPRRDLPAPGPDLPGAVARPRRRRRHRRARPTAASTRRPAPTWHLRILSTDATRAVRPTWSCTSAPSRSPARSPATSAETCSPARSSAPGPRPAAAAPRHPGFW